MHAAQTGHLVQVVVGVECLWAGGGCSVSPGRAAVCAVFLCLGAQQHFTMMPVGEPRSSL